MIEEKCELYNKDLSKGKKSYTVKEICQILGICKGTALKIIHQGLFKSVRTNRQLRIVKISFDEWLEKQDKEV